MGVKGDVVREIQKLLIAKGYKEVSKSGEPDSMFGGMTKAQVEKFQLDNKDDKGEKLKKDGIVGQETINALLKVPTPNTKGLERAVKSYLPTGVSPEL
jgi:peptidoglycan hydrolase-like protein with peptidoglycan-binding domain